MVAMPTNLRVEMRSFKNIRDKKMIKSGIEMAIKDKLMALVVFPAK